MNWHIIWVFVSHKHSDISSHMHVVCIFYTPHKWRIPIAASLICIMWFYSAFFSYFTNFMQICLILNKLLHFLWFFLHCWEPVYNYNTFTLLEITNSILNWKVLFIFFHLKNCPVVSFNCYKRSNFKEIKQTSQFISLKYLFSQKSISCFWLNIIQFSS